MKRYSILHIPLFSFFSRSLYRNVAQHWKGICFWYLVLLLLVTWTPVLLKWDVSVKLAIDNDLPKLLERVPDIEIKNGELSIDKPQPYIIHDPDTNKEMIVIDTTGKINSLDDTKAMMLVTKTKIVMRDENGTHVPVMEFRTIKSLAINQQELQNRADEFKRLFLPISAVLFLFFSLCFRLLQLVIYSIIGLVFSSMCGVNNSFSAVMRISVVAITPGIIIDTVLLMLNTQLAFQYFLPLWIGYFIMAMIYLFIAVQASATIDPYDETNEADTFAPM